MKKILITMVVLLLLLTTTCFAREFTDLDENHWAYSVITKMSKEGILNGYPDGTFGPNLPITRAEFSKILVLSLGRDTRSKEEFKDVAKSHWAYSYIKVASNYLDGSDNYFYPDEKAVREDIVKAMVLAAGFQDKDYDLDTLNKFSDKGYISSGMKKYVAIAVENELFRGNADGTFNPQGRLTRAEVCQVMFNIMEVLEEEEKPTPTPKPTKTATPTKTLTVTPTKVVTPTPTKPSSTAEPTKETILGDVNENGKVDGVDLERLSKYLKGENVTVSQKNSDLNEDGKVDQDDLEILGRHLAGWIDEFPYKGTLIIGDVNDDGKVNASDITKLSQYLEGTGSISLKNADTNDDGKVTYKDLVILSRYVSKIISTLPSSGEVVLYGDVDDDEKITKKDSLALHKYVYSGETKDVNLKNADINADGKVNTMDLIILKRNLAGYEGYDVLPLSSYKGTVEGYGDADGDGTITMDDAVLIFNYSMMPETYPINTQVELIDTNLDGNLDIEDAAIVKYYVDGVIKKLPYTDKLPLLGDVNDDGEVTEEDQTILSRYLANWEGYAEQVNQKNADVDLDGEITMRDAMILARHLAGWEGYETLPYIEPFVMYGDVDDNGEVNEEDQTVLSRYIVGWDGYEDKVNKQNADVDADGEVTPRDSMILARHLAGWEGYEALPYTQ